MKANGNADQSFTNTLLNNGTPVTSGAAYKISANPGGHTPEEISVDPATGEVTFTKALYDKMTPPDLTRSTGPAARITIEATHQGRTASFTFTVTDHFSPRDNHSSVVLGPYIYVIGGVTQISSSGVPQDSDNEVWRSPDGGETWDRLEASDPAKRFSARYALTSAVLGNTVYVIGGQADGSGVPLADVVWSSENGADWTRVPSAAGPDNRLAPRFSHSSVVLDNAIYVINGLGSRTISRPAGTTVLPSIPIREVRKSSDGTNWTNIPITSEADGGAPFLSRNDFAMEMLDNKIYIMGARTGASSTGNDVLESSDGGLWTQVDTSGHRFTERRRHSSAVLGDTLYVIGGIGTTAAANERGDIWKSADKGRRWTQVAANAQVLGRSWHTSPVLGDAIYIIGGSKKIGGLQNDVWKSTDGGVTWNNVHKNP